MGISLSLQTNQDGKFVYSIKKTDKKSNQSFWDLNKFSLGKKIIKNLGVSVKKDDPKAKGNQAWTIEKICDNITQKDEFLQEVRRIKELLEKLENDLFDGKEVSDTEDGDVIDI